MKTNQPRFGLTLAELLVVLTILAVMATVAVTMSDGLVDQGRFDATQRTLEWIEEAILGPTVHGPNGAVQITGFVADMGRLPDPTFGLQELIANPKALLAFGLRTTSDADVQILSGWRGPYLQPPMGSAQLIDGWGNAIAYDGTGVLSFGSNGMLGGTEPFEQDLKVSLISTRYAATVAGQVSLLDAMGNARDTDPAEADDPKTLNVSVVLYGPNSANGGVLEVPATVNQTSPGVYSYTAATTIGPRVVRAYEKYTESGIASVRKSRIVLLMVPPGGLMQPLTIQKP